MIRIVSFEHGDGIHMPLREEFLGVMNRGDWKRLSKSVFFFRRGADVNRWVGPGDTFEYVDEIIP